MKKKRNTPQWFKDAILYQIYPQSFQDSNGDGIGDLPGIISRLDYLEDLGITALWLSPIFDSPFLDAGYDVRDFLKVAPRYGTEEDLATLCREAHRRDMKVLLDFVPGHTSLDHPWFESSKGHDSSVDRDRYIWTDSMYEAPLAEDGKPLAHLKGWGEREGSVATNFFSTQPKLNYGYVNPDPSRPYQLHHEDQRIQERWAEMMDVVRHWLDIGVDGFRVDSAKSLVIGDPRVGTASLFNALRDMMEDEYPEAVLIGEWGWPCDAEKAGFHGSMLLHNMKSWVSLVAQSGWENHREPPFLGDEGDITTFTDEYQYHHDLLEDPSHICFFSCNHDYKRPATARPLAQMFPFFTMVLTFPGTPIVYYGDEIGMTFREGLASVEGGYCRTGSRTPMQWDQSLGRGFSSADLAEHYLPSDPVGEGPCVMDQRGQEDSLLEHVRALCQLRRKHPALTGRGHYRVVFAEQRRYPFIYERFLDDDRFLVSINPSSRSERVSLSGYGAVSLVEGRGVRAIPEGELWNFDVEGESWGVWKVS